MNLSADINFQFADMFDLICGTSTGGIISLAIALEQLSTEV